MDKENGAVGQNRDYSTKKDQNIALVLDKKKTIKPSYILVIIIALIGLSIFFITNGNKSDTKISTNITSNLSTNISEGNNDETNSQTIVTKNVCEGCHMSGKGSVPQALTVQPHLNGGIYCLTCHKFSHDKHPINDNVTCEKCHGYRNETVPISSPNIVCINCHNYPNPLEKSNGNLITVHRLREVSCINCHVDTCTKCHKEMSNSTRWEKRFTHFNTILMKK